MKKIVAGNWKMNQTFQQAIHLFSSLDQAIDSVKSTEILLFPPAVYLHHLQSLKNKKSLLTLGAQNCAAWNAGAYTGEISIPMLQSIGIEWTLIGHSERRTLFGEDLSLVAQKVKHCQQNQFKYILCIGETLQERETGEFETVWRNQLNSALKDLTEKTNLYVAYEPVWAIGTGKTASPKEIAQAHTWIKNYIQHDLGYPKEQVLVLYGGSCNEKNASEILSTPHVDGVLVGGASLKAESFISIIESSEQCT